MNYGSERIDAGRGTRAMSGVIAPTEITFETDVPLATSERTESIC